MQTPVITPRATRPRLSRSSLLLMIAVIVGALAGVISAVADIDPRDADIKYDWLSANAAFASNAYRDVLDLGEEQGIDLVVHYPAGAERPFPHPRTPGAIFLSLPLLLLDFGQTFALSVVITITLGVLLVGILTRSMPASRRVAVFALFAASAPFVTTVRFAGQSMIVALSVVLSWVMFKRERDVAAGLLLAVAGVLKVFPLILVIPMLLQRRFKAAGIAAFATGIFTWLGLLLPGVGLADAFDALARGSEVWFPLLSNGSLAAMMARPGVGQWTAQLVALMFGTGVLVLAVRKRREQALADPTPWLVVALMVLPLSWISYDVVLVVALAGGLWSTVRTARLSTLLIWGIWIGMTAALLMGSQLGPDSLVDMGPATAVARIAVLIAWWSGAIGWRVAEPSGRDLPVPSSNLPMGVR